MTIKVIGSGPNPCIMGVAEDNINKGDLCIINLDTGGIYRQGRYK